MDDAATLPDEDGSGPLTEPPRRRARWRLVQLVPSPIPIQWIDCIFPSLASSACAAFVAHHPRAAIATSTGHAAWSSCGELASIRMDCSTVWSCVVRASEARACVRVRSLAVRSPSCGSDGTERCLGLWSQTLSTMLGIQKMLC